MSKIKHIKENDSDSESESAKSLKRFKIIEERLKIFCVEFFIYAIVLAIVYIIYSSTMDTIEYNKALDKLHKRKFN
jgi:hypothetical protein